jgi:hypothetical protein
LIAISLAEARGNNNSLLKSKLERFEKFYQAKERREEILF